MQGGTIRDACKVSALEQATIRSRERSGAVALSTLSWDRMPSQTSAILRNTTYESLAFFSFPVTAALLACSSVALIIRIAGIRRTGATWCLECGNRLTDKPERERCLECGSRQSQSQ